MQDESLGFLTFFCPIKLDLIRCWILFYFFDFCARVIGQKRIERAWDGPLDWQALPPEWSLTHAIDRLWLRALVRNLPIYGAQRQNRDRKKIVFWQMISAQSRNNFFFTLNRTKVFEKCVKSFLKRFKVSNWPWHPRD